MTQATAKILKASVAKIKSMSRRAARNRGDNKNQWENSVEYRWDITPSGNIEFVGWLKERGTGYPSIITGFQVHFDSDYNVVLRCSDSDKNIYDKIPENVLREICCLVDDVDQNHGN